MFNLEITCGCMESCIIRTKPQDRFSSGGSGHKIMQSGVGGLSLVQHNDTALLLNGFAVVCKQIFLPEVTMLSYGVWE